MINILNKVIETIKTSSVSTLRSVDFAPQDLLALVENLVYSNKALWNLEDLARMRHLGDAHVSRAKKLIDETNHKRNSTIRDIDYIIKNNLIDLARRDDSNYYSETPGMMIDRLSIFYIKVHNIKLLMAQLKDKTLIRNLGVSHKIVSRQVVQLSSFLDSYLGKLTKGELYFETNEPVKIYNDIQLRPFIDEMKSSLNLDDYES
jgi:hypothetical protein